MKPDFFIVGAPKSATTAMYSYLRQHPDIYMPDVKELHFFGTDLHFLPPGRNFVTTPRSSDDLQRYLSYFSAAEESQIIGEASVWYLYSESASQEIRDFCPRAKIIIMLRNPVDLLHAMHSQFLWEGNEDIVDFAQALMAEPERKLNHRLPQTMHFQQGLFYRETVRFHEQIRRYLDCFGPENVLVIIYEEFSRDPHNEYANVLKFLGISDLIVPKFARVNANKRLRSRLLLSLLTRPKPMAKKGAKLIPPSWRSTLYQYLWRVNTQYVPRAPINDGLRQQLLQDMIRDIELLERLLQRDLSIWLASR